MSDSESKAPAKVPEDDAQDVFYSRRWIQETVKGFEAADTDNNGFLSKAEVLKAFAKEYPDEESKITRPAVDGIFKYFDYNDDKKISLGEFIELDMAFDAQILNYSNAILV